MSVTIRTITRDDYERVHAFLISRWASNEVTVDGQKIDVSRLPGHLAEENDEIQGLITITRHDGQWDIITLDSIKRSSGIATDLLEAVVAEARQSQILRLIVRLTNDNLDAFRFFQRRGFRISSVNRGVIDQARQSDSSIPQEGCYNIPLRDEIIFRRQL